MKNYDFCLLLQYYGFNLFSLKTLFKDLICEADNYYERLEALKQDKYQLSNLKLYELETLLKSELLEKIYIKLKHSDSSFLSYSDKLNPFKICEMEDPPFGLFYKGNIKQINRKKIVAIVGTRKASIYGLKIAHEIAVELSKNNIVVISGLAAGVDAEAHKGSFQNGNTIAVLGTGIDTPFPVSNRRLYTEILKNDGLVISEYPPEVGGSAWNFPQRNRVISALSDAVIVVEGDIDSGALITARFAIKQNKKLFAVPGSLGLRTSFGPNALIKSKVAEIFTTIEDFIEMVYGRTLSPIKLNSIENNKSSLSLIQKNILNLITSYPTNFDEILEEVSLPVNEVLKELSYLELKGLIQKTMNGDYVRG